MCIGVFKDFEIARIKTSYSVEFVRSDTIFISTELDHEGREAVTKSLAILSDFDGVLKGLDIREKNLTLSFFYDSQCALEFSSDELNRLSSLVDSLAIDCFQA
jgi:hypothetical protein